MAKILLAEGETDLRWTLRYALLKNKFEVAEAKSGEDVAPELRRSKADLVVLDALMPRKNGLEVLDELKKDPATKAVPVLLLTLSGEKKLIEQAFARGARDVLPKSGFSVMKLLYSVRKALENGGS